MSATLNMDSDFHEKSRCIGAPIIYDHHHPLDNQKYHKKVKITTYKFNHIYIYIKCIASEFNQNAFNCLPKQIPKLSFSFTQREKKAKTQTLMEGVSASMYKGLRGYWTRRGYEKLDGLGRRRKSRVELGSTRRKRVWRIKVAPKLGFLRRMPSPKKLLVWLRDTYVKLMLGFANSRVFSSAYGGGVICNDGTGAYGKGPLKEYDEKMIVEIYKSLALAQGQLVPRDAPRLGSEIVHRR